MTRRRFVAGAVAGLAAGLSELDALRPRPKLFVFLIAEQFRQLYLDRIGNQLQPGGFRELLTKGIYYPDCRMGASGFTSTGLATLATGTYPSLHGIVADQWYERTTHALARARAEMLEASTLADEVARVGNSRIYSLGLDEGPASLLAGRSRGPVFWMNQQGQFVTRGNAPEWLAQYNADRPLDQVHDRKWMAIGASADMPPLRTLNYDSRRPEEFLALYRSSPFCQDAQFDLLRHMITADKLGQGNTLDFVFLSLGSMAFLGYETGSDSVLMEQMAIKLDQQIQLTLEALNATPGKGNYNLIFAAAHGAPPEPNAAMRAQMAIFGETIARGIQQALSARFDRNGAKNIYVEKYVYPFLQLRRATLQKQAIPLRGASKLAGEAALRLPGVSGYYTEDGDCSYTGEWRRRFENSFHELRSGDVMLSYDPGFVEDYGQGRGVSYGSLYNYDTSVPLFLYGAQFAGKVVERAIAAVDLAPTIARAAGVPAPSSATGEVLPEAYADSSDEERAK